MENQSPLLQAQLLEQYQTLDSIRNKATETLTLKAAGSMIASNITGSGKSYIAPEGMGYFPVKDTHNARLLDLFPKIPVSSHTVVISNETAPDGTVALVEEGNEKPLVDSDVAVTKVDMVKYAGIVTVSDEMLTDIDFMTNLIENKLAREVKYAIATAFFSAITSATPNLTSAGLTAGTGSTGKLADIPPAVYEDMVINSGYSPYLWMMNSPDYAKFFNEEKVNLLWYAMNEPIITPCKQVSAGDILGIDPMMFPLYVYKDVTIEIGRVGDDFKNNTVTVRGEARVGWDLNGNCLKAFYLDTIANTLAAIA